jgi:hypothetical protein
LRLHGDRVRRNRVDDRLAEGLRVVDAIRERVETDDEL